MTAHKRWCAVNAVIPFGAIAERAPCNCGAFNAAVKTVVQIGLLAKQHCNVRLPLQVLRSAAGYYLGTFDDQGPCSRESVEYWPTEDAATAAFASGNWTQRDHP